MVERCHLRRMDIGLRLVNFMLFDYVHDIVSQKLAF